MGCGPQHIFEQLIAFKPVFCDKVVHRVLRANVKQLREGITSISLCHVSNLCVDYAKRKNIALLAAVRPSHHSSDFNILAKQTITIIRAR